MATELLKLVTAIDSPLETARIDPFSYVASVHVSSLSEDGWRIVAGNAGVPVPSVADRVRVVELYRARAAKAA